MRKRKSLSLIETLIAAAVLSLGVILICQGLLVTLGGYNYSLNYLNIIFWMDTKLWDAHDQLVHYRTLTTENNAGTVLIDNRKFNWNLSSNLIEGTEEMSLYELKLRVFWNEGARKVQTLKTKYALFIHEQ